MNDSDLLDQRLDDLFRGAHDSPRWTGNPWDRPAARVRSAARRQRTVHVGIAAAGTAAAAVAAVAGVVALPHPSDNGRTVTPAGDPGAASGADWLLTPSQFSAYAAVHPSPSSQPPSVSSVPSPVPLDDEARLLRDEVLETLPAGASVIRVDPADGGQPQAVVWATLADGTPVAVERRKLEYPMQVGGDAEGARESATTPQDMPDGSAYTVLTGGSGGYSFGQGNRAWSGPFVWTATKDGWFTMWTAPVPEPQLVAWARASDERFTSR